MTIVVVSIGRLILVDKFQQKPTSYFYFLPSCDLNSTFVMIRSTSSILSLAQVCNVSCAFCTRMNACDGRNVTANDVLLITVCPQDCSPVSTQASYMPDDSAEHADLVGKLNEMVGSGVEVTVRVAVLTSVMAIDLDRAVTVGIHEFMEYISRWWHHTVIDDSGRYRAC